MIDQRPALAAQIEAFAATPMADLLPLDGLRSLIADWPNADWSRPAVSRTYRAALLRQVCLAHFLRHATLSSQAIDPVPLPRIPELLHDCPGS